MSHSSRNLKSKYSNIYLHAITEYDFWVTLVLKRISSTTNFITASWPWIPKLASFLFCTLAHMLIKSFGWWRHDRLMRQVRIVKNIHQSLNLTSLMNYSRHSSLFFFKLNLILLYCKSWLLESFRNWHKLPVIYNVDKLGSILAKSLFECRTGSNSRDFREVRRFVMVTRSRQLAEFIDLMAASTDFVHGNPWQGPNTLRQRCKTSCLVQIGSLWHEYFYNPQSFIRGIHGFPSAGQQSARVHIAATRTKHWKKSSMRITLLLRSTDVQGTVMSAFSEIDTTNQRCTSI